MGAKGFSGNQILTTYFCLQLYHTLPPREEGSKEIVVGDTNNGSKQPDPEWEDEESMAMPITE